MDYRQSPKKRTIYRREREHWVSMAAKGRSGKRWREERAIQEKWLRGKTGVITPGLPRKNSGGGESLETERNPFLQKSRGEIVTKDPTNSRRGGKPRRGANNLAKAPGCGCLLAGKASTREIGGIEE